MATLVCFDPTLVPADPRPDLSRIATERPRPLASAGGDICILDASAAQHEIA